MSGWRSFGNRPREGRACGATSANSRGGVIDVPEHFLGSTGKIAFCVLPYSSHWRTVFLAEQLPEEVSIGEIRSASTHWEFGFLFPTKLTFTNKKSGVVKIAIIDEFPSYQLRDCSGTLFRFTHDAQSPDTAVKPGTFFHGHAVASLVSNTLLKLGIKHEITCIDIKSSASGKPRFEAISSAIIWASENLRPNYINLSLGEYHDAIKNPSIVKQLENAVDIAAESGCTCFAAIGNSDNRGIAVPAALDQVIAVASLGYSGAYPERSLCQFIYKQNEKKVQWEREFSKGGKVFVPSNTPKSSSVNVFAPGFGVISDMEEGYSRDFMGTSFATPLALSSQAVAHALSTIHLTNDKNQFEKQISCLRSLLTYLDTTKYGAEIKVPIITQEVIDKLSKNDKV